MTPDVPSVQEIVRHFDANQRLLHTTLLRADKELESRGAHPADRKRELWNEQKVSALQIAAHELARRVLTRYALEQRSVSIDEYMRDDFFFAEARDLTEQVNETYNVQDPITMPGVFRTARKLLQESIDPGMPDDIDSPA